MDLRGIAPTAPAGHGRIRTVSWDDGTAPAEGSGRAALNKRYQADNVRVGKAAAAPASVRHGSLVRHGVGPRRLESSLRSRSPQPSASRAISPGPSKGWPRARELPGRARGRAPAPWGCARGDEGEGPRGAAQMRAIHDAICSTAKSALPREQMFTAAICDRRGVRRRRDGSPGGVCEQLDRVESKPESDPLDASECEVALAALDPSHVCAVHAELIRERLLAHASSFTMRTQVPPESALQVALHTGRLPTLLLSSLQTYE